MDSQNQSPTTILPACTLVYLFFSEEENVSSPRNLPLGQEDLVNTSKDGAHCVTEMTHVVQSPTSHAIHEHLQTLDVRAHAFRRDTVSSWLLFNLAG